MTDDQGSTIDILGTGELRLRQPRASGGLGSGMDVSRLRYERDFAQVPGVVFERLPRLGENGLVLYCVVARRVGHQPKRKDGVYHVELATRYLKQVLGWEYARQKRAKAALVAGIPEAFSLIPGDARSNKGDTLVFRQHAMYQLQNDFLDGNDGDTRSRDDSRPAVTTPPGLLSQQEQACSCDTSKVRDQEIREVEITLSACADGGGTEPQKDATTGCAGAHTTIVTKTRKRKGQREAAGTYQKFLSSWNANRFQSANWSWGQTFTSSPALEGHIKCLMARHDGNEEAALAEFTGIVQFLAARVADNPHTSFWGDRTRDVLPNLSNLMSNYQDWLTKSLNRNPLAAKRATLPHPDAPEATPDHILEVI